MVRSSFIIMTKEKKPLKLIFVCISQRVQELKEKKTNESCSVGTGQRHFGWFWKAT